MKLIKLRCLAIAILLFATCKKYEPPVAPTNVDFTLNLDEQANSNLKTKGKWMAANSIIIIYAPDGKYYALQQTCSYKQCNLEYLDNSQLVQCPCHNCMFEIINGTVYQGPAGIALKTYNATLTGNKLQIKSK
ncbi:MAG: Rieske 2Fe-2S domain-containing protein [Bacteroidetes bacterium]|nr:Rieske 2Fe-2S domain-containing protein [Bacteroidota bacterium]